MYALYKIDEFFRPDHKYLTEEDDCYCFMSYKSFRKYGRNAENVLIMDFKIEADNKDGYVWGKKIKAINKIAEILDESLPEIPIPDVIFVPIPPSKVKSDPQYDDRILQVLNLFAAKRKNADVREVILLKKNLTATHKTGKKYSPEDILESLILDKNQCIHQKEKIVLFDDVITTGAHFKACQKLLSGAFPQSEIKGLFIARTPLY